MTHSRAEATASTPSIVSLSALRSDRNLKVTITVRLSSYLLMTDDAMRRIRLFQICDFFLGQFNR